MSIKDEENYLDNLLKNVMEPHPVQPKERETADVEVDSTIEMKTEEEAEEIAAEEPVVEEPQAESILEEPAAEETVEEVIPEAPEEDISIEEIESLLAEVNSNSEIREESEETAEAEPGLDELLAEAEPSVEAEEPAVEEPQTESILEELAAEEPVVEEPQAESILEELAAEEPAVEEPQAESILEELAAEEPVVEEPQAESILEELAAEEPVVEEPQAESILEELAAEEPAVEEPQTESISEELSVDETSEEFSLEDIDSLLAEADSTSVQSTDDLLKGLDLNLDAIEAETTQLPEDDDLFKELDMGDAEAQIATAQAVDTATEEEDFEDVLSLLNDDDSELAEINDLLKKSDSSEPVQDDMMTLLNQLADDEKQQISDSKQDGQGFDEEELLAMVEDADTGKTAKKTKGASKNEKVASDEPQKKQGALAKIFNTLTEEFEPEPTEEELAKEAEEKAAAKLEAKAKKEEEKKAKAEEKKAKAEEKEAAKKAKAEADAQKKREKQEAKEAKRAEKLAKEEAERPKNQKRISPKKMVLVTIMAASVLVGVLLFAEYASTEGSLQRARRAYYEGNYQTVYLEMYGQNLEESDAIVQARSKVILKMQRKYDSYVNHAKMGQEVEALNALIEGLGTYDDINLEAEQYGVATEVNDIKTDILNVLQVRYGLDETAARELLQNEDEISYTKSLNHIIMRDSGDLASNSYKTE